MRKNSYKNVHELKIVPNYFEDVMSGDKTFEVRKNDRPFKLGDYLLLREWHPSNGYTGRRVIKKISYMLNDPQYVKEGFVILGILAA